MNEINNFSPLAKQKVNKTSFEELQFFSIILYTVEYYTFSVLFLLTCFQGILILCEYCLSVTNDVFEVAKICYQYL